MEWKELKAALISILIGAIVAFITTAMQGLLSFLQHIPVEGPAIIAALTKYGTYLYSVQPPRHG